MRNENENENKNGNESVNENDHCLNWLNKIYFKTHK